MNFPWSPIFFKTSLKSSRAEKSGTSNKIFSIMIQHKVIDFGRSWNFQLGNTIGRFRGLTVLKLTKTHLHHATSPESCSKIWWASQNPTQMFTVHEFLPFLFQNLNSFVIIFSTKKYIDRRFWNNVIMTMVNYLWKTIFRPYGKWTPFI